MADCRTGLSPSVAVQPLRAFFVHAQRLVADGTGKKLFRMTLAVASLVFDLDRVRRNDRVGIADAQQTRVVRACAKFPAVLRSLLA